MAERVRLDPARTALVLVDLQQGIVAMPGLGPRSADDVVKAATALADRFRVAGAPVVLVHVGWAADGADRPPRNVDRPPSLPPDGLPREWMQLVEGVLRDGDIVVHKRQWGAFTGTDLDLQLRRRGVSTIVLAGIATNFGVESTARNGWELGYDIVVAEDATTSRSAELHDFAIAHILPQIARIRASAEIELD
jgi:nicotinamidase-related amidase